MKTKLNQVFSLCMSKDLRHGFWYWKIPFSSDLNASVMCPRVNFSVKSLAWKPWQLENQPKFHCHQVTSQFPLPSNWSMPEDVKQHQCIMAGKHNPLSLNISQKWIGQSYLCQASLTWGHFFLFIQLAKTPTN